MRRAGYRVVGTGGLNWKVGINGIAQAEKIKASITA
jgi:hypothetical protein